LRCQQDGLSALPIVATSFVQFGLFSFMGSRYLSLRRKTPGSPAKIERNRSNIDAGDLDEYSGRIRVSVQAEILKGSGRL